MIKREEIKGWNILIVDDEPDSLEVARRVLNYHEASVTVASGGREAWEVALRETPNLILTDLSMPEFDGWQLLFQVRENPNTKLIPVIALTAHAMKGDQERALSAGFDGYVTKPMSPVSLVDDILNILSVKGATSKG